MKSPTLKIKQPRSLDEICDFSTFPKVHSKFLYDRAFRADPLALHDEVLNQKLEFQETLRTHVIKAPNVVFAIPNLTPQTSGELAEFMRAVRQRLIAVLTGIAGAYCALLDGKTIQFKSLREKFDALAEAWEDHHLGLSVTDYDHVAYTQIVGMGKPAIPLLLEKLAEGDPEWVYALKCITGEQAETVDMHGDPDRIIEAWLEWGKKHGIHTEGQTS